MQSIQAGTTATFPPDSVSPDTLGNKWVIIQENADGTDGQEVGIAGGGGNGWNASAVDSPNLTITAPASALSGTVYRAACASVVGGNLTGNMYDAKFLVTPAPLRNPTLMAVPSLADGVPAIILTGSGF